MDRDATFTVYSDLTSPKRKKMDKFIIGPLHIKIGCQRHNENDVKNAIDLRNVTIKC